MNTKTSISVLSKYEDRDLDFKYIVQSAGLLDKVSPETVVNPTWSAGSDKGRLVKKCTKNHYISAVIGIICLRETFEYMSC